MSPSSNSINVQRMLLVIRLLMTGVFLYGAAIKLTGTAGMVSLFNMIGVGQWLRYVIGSLELIGGLTLLVPRYAGVAALGLMVLMIGALMTEIVITQHFPLMALLSVSALMIIAWYYRVETRRLITPSAPPRSTALPHR